MDFERPRTPEFTNIPIRYLYVKVERLREIREEIEMEGTKWRVVEVNYGDNNEFYNSNGSVARLTVTPVSEFESKCIEQARSHRIRAEVEAMDWPETIKVPWLPE